MAIPSLEHVMAFGDVTTASTGLLYYGIDDGKLIISRYMNQCFPKHIYGKLAQQLQAFNINIIIITSWQDCVGPTRMLFFYITHETGWCNTISLTSKPRTQSFKNSFMGKGGSK